MEHLKYQKDRQALQEFLMDIEILDKLEEHESGFNAFEVLGIIHKEIRHSNVLGWLLNPAEYHNFDDRFIKKVIHHCVKHDSREEPAISYKPLEILLQDFNDMIIRREWANIDILGISKSNKFVLVIENKIWSKESSHQLNKYRRIIESEFPDYTKLYIYLTPEGDDASDTDNWLSLSYEKIMEFLESILKIRRQAMSKESLIFIEQYLSILRRNIVGDKELEKICVDIYSKHKRALDLIFEYKPDIYKSIHDKLLEIIDGHPDLIADHSNKQYVRFTTKNLDEHIAKTSEGWTESGRILLFEVANFKDKLFLKLVIGPGDSEHRERLHKTALRHPSTFKRLSKRLSPQYCSMFLTDIYKHDEGRENDPVQMMQEIESKLKSFMDNRLEEIEKVFIENDLDIYS
ncbi:PD-(D/E)XK nuclease family protein [Salinicoccus sp. HZC-1]|uniref:PDDEXK-like family protein n=1 Tax=Salinicoccus sp. HZC-1 TaxID=3385497 RepID=UPI00398AA472